MSERFSGTLYASTNKSTPGALKLGKTEKTAQSRSRQTVTGSPYPMVPVAWAEFQVADSSELILLEKRMHRHPLIAEFKINYGGGKEWFNVSIETFNKVTREMQYAHPPTRAWLEQKAINDKKLAEELAARKKEERIAAIKRKEHSKSTDFLRAESYRTRSIILDDQYNNQILFEEHSKKDVSSNKKEEGNGIVQSKHERSKKINFLIILYFIGLYIVYLYVNYIAK